jgi:hypothetical protein
MNPLWVFGALLAGIVLLGFFGFLRPVEGFQVKAPSSVYKQELKQMIRCPVGYTAFHSPAGDSLCCKGEINPYTHQCSSLTTTGICALSANVQDPRDPTKILPLCSSLIEDTYSSESAAQCPTSLPNYAEESETIAKCCKNPIVIRGAGFGCSSEDRKDRSNYCVVKGPLATGEQRCDAMAAYDKAQCPTDSAGREVFQKVEYKLGDREADYYKVPDLKGIPIPTCFRMNESCIPRSSLEYAQVRGAFIEYNPDTWEYSCDVWKKKAGGAMVDVVKGYLKPTASM